MKNNLGMILENLNAIFLEKNEWIKPPYLYLDPQGVRYFFQDLTGLTAPPGTVLQYEEDCRLIVSNSPGEGTTPPPQMLFESMIPLLNEKMPLVSTKEDLEGLSHQYVRVEGYFQTTRFPDGNLNLEVNISGVRGLLFFNRANFNSMVRPLLGHDRFHTLSNRVEAWVFLHGPIERTIFYHQSYGDNAEHDWLAIVPVAMRTANLQSPS